MFSICMSYLFCCYNLLFIYLFFFVRNRFVLSLENDLTVRAKTTEVAVKDFSSGSYATIFGEEVIYFVVHRYDLLLILFLFVFA